MVKSRKSKLVLGLPSGGRILAQEQAREGCEEIAENRIVVRGAREHNLKNVTVSLPRDVMVVVTGLSGSGKSSLAFDTIYAEGQRRYVESLSAYARQFLGQMDKPEVDHEQPPLHGRYRDGDLRLPPPSLRPRREAALSRLRLPRRLIDAAADGREGTHPPREDALHGARACSARAQ